MIAESMWITKHGDSLWSFLGGVLATGVLGYLFYRLAEKPKRLDTFPVTATSILAVPKAERSQLPLAVTSHGNVVKDPNLVVVRVMNTGKEPVVRGDLERPIEFVFTGSESVFNTIRRSSPGFEAEITSLPSGNAGFRVDFFCLNGGEWFEVQSVTSGEPVFPKVSARYAGQTKPIRDLARYYSRRRYLGASWGALLFSTSLLAAGIVKTSPGTAQMVVAIALLLAFLGGCAAVVWGERAAGKAAKLRRITAAQEDERDLGWRAAVHKVFFDYFRIIRSRP